MDRQLPLHEDKTEGYTPVRRRFSTINARQFHGDSETEWTAPRCNRLLRALQSRVAILNKELSRVQSVTRGPEAAVVVKAGRVRKADPDTDWNQARKKIKRTYTTRGGRCNNDSRFQGLRKLQAANDSRPYIPGEVSVPTPMLNRARGELATTKSSTVPPLEVEVQELMPNKYTRAKEIQSNTQLSQKLRGIRKRTPASRYAIYEGIYNGLETLLRATAPEEPQRTRTGSTSLLSLCLRTVPQYIAQEEKLFVAHMEETKSKSAIDRRDISTEVYDDLEAFGCNGKGWRHLKPIVRSHGIHLVCDAIRAGSLDAEFIGILVTLCIHTKAKKEGEILLSTLLSTTRYPVPKSVFTRFDDEPAMQPLSVLWKFVEVTGSFSFRYRQISTLISCGCLPLSWLATKELGPVWTRAIQALPTTSNDTDALLFMDDMLPLLARANDLPWGHEDTGEGDNLMLDAMKHTFSSLLTTLSSIVILSRESTTSPNQNTRARTTEYDYFISLMRTCHMQSGLSPIFNVQGTLLVIANIILDIEDPKPESNRELVHALMDHLRHMNKLSSILPSFHEIVSFICSIARCCGRGASNSGFEYLETLHQKLEGFICNCDLESGNIIREILADSALAFAQQLPDCKHLDYADAMEAKVHRAESKCRASLTPGTFGDNSRIGFRWEEGISEWVTVTPLISTNRCQDRSYSRAHELECETPFRPAMQRKIKKPVLPHARKGVLRSSEKITPFGPRSESSPASELPQPGSDDDANGTGSELDSIDEDESGDDPADGDLGNSPDILRSADDTVDLESIELDHEASSDELQLESPRSDLSNDCDQDSFPQSNRSLMDDSFTSVSSANSVRSIGARSGRRHIDRVPRLSRRVLRHSLQWQLFEDENSDDELSFMSVSSESSAVLQDVTNRVVPRTKQQRQTKLTPVQKAVGHFSESFLGSSEDELCI